MAWRGARRGSVLRLLGVAVALGGGVVWWWAVLRLAVVPQAAGTVEGVVVAGGWGLSLLPVHCVPWAQAVGERAAKRRSARGPSVHRRVVVRLRAGVTTAWRRRRSGGGSDRS
ncbi:hypothetical protein [Streptomyces sp. NPDC002851]